MQLSHPLHRSCTQIARKLHTNRNAQEQLPKGASPNRFGMPGCVSGQMYQIGEAASVICPAGMQVSHTPEQTVPQVDSGSVQRLYRDRPAGGRQQGAAEASRMP